MTAVALGCLLLAYAPSGSSDRGDDGRPAVAVIDDLVARRAECVEFAGVATLKGNEYLSASVPRQVREGAGEIAGVVTTVLWRSEGWRRELRMPRRADPSVIVYSNASGFFEWTDFAGMRRTTAPLDVPGRTAADFVFAYFDGTRYADLLAAPDDGHGASAAAVSPREELVAGATYVDRPLPSQGARRIVIGVVPGGVVHVLVYENVGEPPAPARRHEFKVLSWAADGERDAIPVTGLFRTFSHADATRVNSEARYEFTEVRFARQRSAEALAVPPGSSFLDSITGRVGVFDGSVEQHLRSLSDEAGRLEGPFRRPAIVPLLARRGGWLALSFAVATLVAAASLRFRARFSRRQVTSA